MYIFVKKLTTTATKQHHNLAEDGKQENQ